MSLDDPIVAAVLADLAPAVQPAPATAGLPSRFACFVTGTDTEIGKTLTSSALLHALVARGVRACGMKPVAASMSIAWIFSGVSCATASMSIPPSVDATIEIRPVARLTSKAR